MNRVRSSINTKRGKRQEENAMTTSWAPHTPAERPFGATYTEGLAAAAAMFFREFFDAAFSPYHPEKHYMRGPGPASRAKMCAANNSRCSRA